jgi:hypothetical protein
MPGYGWGMLPRPPRTRPAVPAGTWRAARGRFFKLVRPRSLPIEVFTRPVSVQIGNSGIAQGIVSGAGAATVAIGPQGYGTRWYPNQLSIATQTGAADTSTCAFYLNVIGPGGFLGQSYAGGGDQPGFAVPEMQPGDLLYAVWAGAHTGDWVQLMVIGPMDLLIPA